MKIRLFKLDLWLDQRFGWFFTNGRKQHIWISRVKSKEKELKRLEKIEKIKNGK